MAIKDLAALSGPHMELSQLRLVAMILRGINELQVSCL